MRESVPRDQHRSITDQAAILVNGGQLEPVLPLLVFRAFLQIYVHSRPGVDAKRMHSLLTHWCCPGFVIRQEVTSAHLKFHSVLQAMVHNTESSVSMASCKTSHSLNKLSTQYLFSALFYSFSHSKSVFVRVLRHQVHQHTTNIINYFTVAVI